MPHGASITSRCITRHPRTRREHRGARRPYLPGESIVTVKPAPPAKEPSELSPHELVTRLATALRGHGVTLPTAG